MNRQETFDRLELDDDTLSDDEIEPVPAIDQSPLVGYRHRHLPFEREPANRKLPREARFVRRLQESGTYDTMYLDQSADDVLRTILEPSPLLLFVFHPSRRSPDLAGCVLSIDADLFDQELPTAMGGDGMVALPRAVVSSAYSPPESPASGKPSRAKGTHGSPGSAHT
jgi:hypothetical protein